MNFRMDLSVDVHESARLEDGRRCWAYSVSAHPSPLHPDHALFTGEVHVPPGSSERHVMGLVRVQVVCELADLARRVRAVR